MSKTNYDSVAKTNDKILTVIKSRRIKQQETYNLCRLRKIATDKIPNTMTGMVVFIC